MEGIVPSEFEEKVLKIVWRKWLKIEWLQLVQKTIHIKLNNMYEKEY